MHMTLGFESTAELASGTRLPLLGLGVWKMQEGKETEDAVTWALEAGYRHIDTAKLYANEASVGFAVRQFMAGHSIQREEFFVTTKLWPTDFLNPRAGFDRSLAALNLGYIDLYLIHWPSPVMPKSVWQTLEEVYEEGLVRAIGVSNYDEADIEKVLSYAKVAPMVNQVEFNPESHDLNLLEYCKSKDIVVEAYSPLGQGGLIKNRTVASIAEKYNKTPAQVLIRWALQHGTVVIPKSSNKQRIKENTEVFDFDISEEDIQTLNALS
jgi:diketogulonate reductase-like aldo/keto reductase